MRKFEITTPCGDKYYIHDNAVIERADMPGQQSGDWELIGFEMCHSFQSFIRFDSIDTWLSTKPELLYKNGNPRYTVRDNDHGTFRSWGNTKHHGIKSIHILDGGK